MAEQRRAARAAWKGSGDKASDELRFDLVEEKGGTEFVGYTSEQGEGEIIAIVREGARVDRASVGEPMGKIGRDTRRERGCQYMKRVMLYGQLKKKKESK